MPEFPGLPVGAARGMDDGEGGGGVRGPARRLPQKVPGMASMAWHSLLQCGLVLQHMRRMGGVKLREIRAAFTSFLEVI